ncbi:hypothetical protein ACJX0J_036802, partial [Zea mays]
EELEYICALSEGVVSVINLYMHLLLPVFVMQKNNIFASNIFSAACIYTLIYDTDVFTTWFFYLIAGIIPNNFLTSESLGQLSASDVCILIHGQYFSNLSNCIIQVALQHTAATWGL